MPDPDPTPQAPAVRAPTTLTRTSVEGSAWAAIVAAYLELMDHVVTGFPALKYLGVIALGAGLPLFAAGVRRAIFALDGHKVLKAFFGAETVEERIKNTTNTALDAVTKIGAVFLALLFVIGCASTPTFEQQLNIASRAYLAAKKGYLVARDSDNKRVEDCYARQPAELAGPELAAACPPVIPQSTRDQVQELVEQADMALVALELLVPVSEQAPATRAHVDALANVQTAALRVPLLVAEGVR